MKRTVLIVFVFAVLFSAISAQKIGKPTLDAVEPNAAQRSLIDQGVDFHDQGEYDLAILKYQEVLRACPDCALALYEMALSYYNKKDAQKTLEIGYKLVKYKGKIGVLGYGLLANTLDDQGKPDDAIEIYLSGITQLKDDPQYSDHLSSLYFNLGVTYSRLKRYTDARGVLKKAVESDYDYASPHYLLGINYSIQNYKIPAFLASGRFVTLELNSDRAKIASNLVKETLKPAEKSPTGEIKITLNMNAPQDEGEFAMYELILGTLMRVKADKDKDKTENEIFADAIDSVLAMIVEDKKLKSTFVGKAYVPFYAEMRAKGFSKHFAYVILQQNGSKEAEEWLIGSAQKTLDFFDWAKNYRLK